MAKSTAATTLPTVNIHEAKTHLSRLVEKAANGEPFIIAKAGKPMVRVTAIDALPPAKQRRIGFGMGMSRIPKDIKKPFEKEIEEMFYGK
ncbi:MAG TPA: type II toxin-antitoxin system prevent-host-death family antitoxin [Acidobacteriaceae bacterium]